MPEFSTEFWVDTGIAAVALLVGLAVTLAMDAKTRGEFRFASGCFLLTAAITVYGIGVLEMTIMWPTRLRVPLAWVLFATVAVLTCESIRWAHARHLRAVAAHEPPGTAEVLPPTTSDVHVTVKQAPTQTVETKVEHPKPSEPKQPAHSELLPQIAQDVGEIKKNVVPVQRHLSDEQRGKLIASLRAGAGFETAVRHSQSNMESQVYADEFVAVLKEAGWTVQNF